MRCQPLPEKPFRVHPLASAVFRSFPHRELVAGKKKPGFPKKTGLFGPYLHWCARQDLNLHTLRLYHLKVARLPISPRARCVVRFPN